MVFINNSYIWKNKVANYLILITTMYFKGRVTLFFANNYLTEYRITMEF